MIGRQRIHHVGTIGHWLRNVRSIGSCPIRNAIVNEVSEVGLWIIVVRTTYRVFQRVRRGNSVADQSPMLMQISGQDNRVYVIVGDRVSICAIVHHFYALPTIVVFSVIQANVISRFDNLIFEINTRNVVGIGSFYRDSDGLTGRWHRRFMAYLSQMGRTVYYYQSVRISWRRLGRTPTAAEVIVDFRIDELNRRSWLVADRRPWKAEVVRNFVDQRSTRCAQSNRFATATKPSSPWANRWHLIFGSKRRWVLSHNEELSRKQLFFDIKFIVDTAFD